MIGIRVHIAALEHCSGQDCCQGISAPSGHKLLVRRSKPQCEHCVGLCSFKQLQALCPTPLRTVSDRDHSHTTTVEVSNGIVSVDDIIETGHDVMYWWYQTKLYQWIFSWVELGWIFPT